MKSIWLSVLNLTISPKYATDWSFSWIRNDTKWSHMFTNKRFFQTYQRFFSVNILMCSSSTITSPLTRNLWNQKQDANQNQTGGLHFAVLLHTMRSWPLTKASFQKRRSISKMRWKSAKAKIWIYFITNVMYLFLSDLLVVLYNYVCFQSIWNLRWNWPLRKISIA